MNKAAPCFYTVLFCSRLSSPRSRHPPPLSRSPAPSPRLILRPAFKARAFFSYFVSFLTPLPFPGPAPGKRFFDPLPNKILRFRTRRIMRARQKDPRAGAFRFRGRGRVCARARLDFARAGAFRLFFASWLSCFGLWPGPVVWACGLGLWSGLVAWACGLGLWPGLVAWACGLGLWPGLVVWACGLGLWPGLVAWAVWHIRPTARTKSTSRPSPRVLLASDPPPFRPTACPPPSRPASHRRTPPGPPKGFYAPGLLSW